MVYKDTYEEMCDEYFYSAGLQAVEDVLNAENLVLLNCVKLSLLEMLSRIGIYEEEVRITREC